MKPKVALIISTLWLMSPTAFTQNYSETYKAVASDRGAGDYFAKPVCISGNYAIAGASMEDEDTAGENPLENAGSAYIFERDTAGNWSEKQKIVASDRAAGDRFGNSLSISGNYAIAGAWFEDEDSVGENTMDEAGSVYIYKRDGYGDWSQVQKIVASDRSAGDHFGRSVGISGSLIIIGATQEDEDTAGNNTFSDAGAAYLFSPDENGVWHEIQKIVASDRATGDHFGLSVDISDQDAVVGAREEDEDEHGENTVQDAGSAYIFKPDDNGKWHEVQKVVAPFRGVGDQFGVSVDISENYIAIGAATDDENASEGDSLTNAGSVYIFKRQVNGTWSLAKKIVPSDRAEGDYFGIVVSISGNSVIAGAYYECHDASGGNYLEYSGSAYIFERDVQENWIEKQKIVASDRAAWDFFGFSASISGDYAIVGAYLDSEDAQGENTLEYAGSAYLFESCIQVPCCETDPENMLNNGNFEECILSPWYLYLAAHLGSTADAVLTGGECTVSAITLTSDPQPWDIQLNQSLSQSQLNRLEVGANYGLTFNAWSETDNRQCRITFEQDEDPWNNLLDEYFTMNTEPVAFSYEFLMSAVHPSMKLSIQAGAESIPFTIDNVRLVKKSGNALHGNTANNAVKIMPNPAADFILIEAQQSSVVFLYDKLGICLKEFSMTGEHEQLDISKLAKGIYIIEIRQGSWLTCEKVIIQ